MRILHVITSLSFASGGPTNVILALTAEQARAGHDVAICTTDRGDLADDLPAIKKMLSPRVELYSFSTQWHALHYSSQLKAWVNNNIANFDVIHIHGLYRFPPTFAAHRARKLGLPYIIRTHGSLDPYLYRQSSRSVWLKRLYERWFDLPNLNAASAIHYTTEDECKRAAFLKLGALSFIIPNGLAWDRYAELPERGAFRRRLDLGDEPMVLFLGRLNFKKGLDLLIPAFAKAKEEHPNAHMAIVGPDNEKYGMHVRQWVRAHELQEAVHFVDLLRGDAVIQAYVDADVFALPSYTENFGMSVVESLACGTPVVISDQVNIHKEIAAAGAGLITKCDVVEISEALSSLLGDTTRRAEMGAAGRDLVKSKWTWEIVAQDLMTEYKNVINNHRLISTPLS